MIAIFKHELRSAFNSLTVYLFCAALLLFVGVGALLYNIQASVANFEYVLSFVSIGLVVFIPLLTMKVFAEERKQKTDQLLYSLPLKTWEIVLGKYLALVVMYLLPLLVIAIYPYIFSKYGDVYLPTSYGSLLAFFMLGSSLIAIGMFISSISDNQGFAAGISIVVFLFNYYSVTLSEQVSSTTTGALIALIVVSIVLALIVKSLTKNSIAGLVTGILLIVFTLSMYVFFNDTFTNLLPNFMKELSLFSQFSTFVNGVFDLSSIVFYLTIIIFGNFLTVQSLEKRRYN